MCCCGVESGVHVRQPGKYLMITCECSGERLSDPGDLGEEMAVEVNHV
jgi:hypothetical protein